MELDFVSWLGERLPPHPALRIGVGDDAALLDLPTGQLVTTADLLIDGVHFLTAEHSPERIGRKALAVNLSDLAAMAARPAGALVSLALPRDGAGGLDPDELAKRLIEGMLPLAAEFGCPIIGGDTNIGAGPLTIAVTALGEPTEHGVVRRDGAEPGDALLVTGKLGGSLAGKHLDFTPRVVEALELQRRAKIHAMMDLSDGLSLDLRRMCQASGVGAVVDVDNLPFGNGSPDGPGPWREGAIVHAIKDGEDFELLLAVHADEARPLLADPPPCGLTRIGEITQEPGVVERRENGPTRPLPTIGYEHR